MILPESYRRSGIALRRLAAMPRADFAISRGRSFDRRLPDKTGGAKRVRDLDIGARLERQQGGANGCVLEDSPCHEAMLERNASFHVRPAVIDAAGNREQPVMDG